MVMSCFVNTFKITFVWYANSANNLEKKVKIVKNLVKKLVKKLVRILVKKLVNKLVKKMRCYVNTFKITFVWYANFANNLEKKE